MKIFAFILVLLFMVNIAFTQIQITFAKNGMANGDKINILYGPNVNFTPGPEGPGKNWIYNAFASKTGETLNWTDPKNTKHGNIFTNATTSCFDSVNNLTNYFKINATGMYVLGMAYTDDSLAYSDPETWLTFSFGYNSVIHDDFYGTGKYMEFDYTFKGHVDVTGDAYGTLSLCGYYFNDVLRVSHMEKTIDCLTEGSLKDTVNITFDNLTTYDWYTADSKYPILECLIDTSYYISNQDTSPIYVSSDIRINHSLLLGVPETKKQLQTTIYPNPFENYLYFTVRNPGYEPISIIIYDMNGKAVISRVYQSNETSIFDKIDVRDIPVGIYMARINSREGMVVKKVLKNNVKAFGKEGL